MERVQQRRTAGPDALIIVHDRLEHPLWDRRAAALADAVEQRLDGAFVTSVGVARGGPCLQDGFRAARFVGSQSARVVVGDDLTARRIAGVSAVLPFSVIVAPEWTAEAIAAASRAEVDRVGRRACA